MSVFKSCLGGTGRAFGRLLTRMAVSGRQGIRRIRRLGRRRTARSASTPSRDSSSQIQTSDKKPSTVIEELGDFGQLPPEVLQSLYGYLTSKDVLTMRRLNTTFKEDVSSFAGINIDLWGKDQRYKFVRTIAVKSLKINEIRDIGKWNRRQRRENSTSVRWLHLRLNLRYRKYRFLRTSGIDPNKIDDHFNPEKVKELRLKYPARLKKLHIVFGMISLGDLQYICQNCPGLEVFDIQFSDLNRCQPGLFNTPASPTLPQGLKTLRIRNPYSERGILKVGNILLQDNFLQLTKFHLWLEFLNDSGQTNRGVSLLVAKFIQNNAFSLTDVDIDMYHIHGGVELKIAFFDHGALQRLQHDAENKDDRTKKLELADLDLRMNCHLMEWKQSLTDQKWLTTSVLRLDGPNWAYDFRLAMRNCWQTLREITISNITMPAESPPLDIGHLFQDCYRLEKLGLLYDMWPPPPYLSRSRVLNITQLPRSLKELHLKYFVLGTDDETEILQQLPRLEKLQLEHWTESDASLAGFLRKLSSAFKLKETNISSFLLKGTSIEFQIGIPEIHNLFQDFGGRKSIYQSSLYKGRLNEETIKIDWYSICDYVSITCTIP